MTDGDSALTVKELVLRVEGKLDTYISLHEQRHAADTAADVLARGDPAGSPAGRAILQQLTDISRDTTALATTVAGHEKTIQRLVGGMILLTMMGLGTVGLISLRIIGVLP